MGVKNTLQHLGFRQTEGDGGGGLFQMYLCKYLK